MAMWLSHLRVTNRTDLYDVYFEDVNCQGNYSRDVFYQRGI